MGPLVSTEWLAGADGVRIVDASWFLPEHGHDAAAEYRAGHVPDAEFVDLSSVKPGGIDLDPDQPVVVYDNSPLRTAARGWWLFRSSGAKQVAILDGGLAKWRTEGRPLDSGEGRHVTSSLTPHFVAALRTISDVRGTGDQIVDARSPARFAGAEPEPRPGVEPGHIPSAINLHYATLYNPDGTWKQGEALEAAFAGVDLDRPTIATCGSGITACSLVFGMHLLGREAALYNGSWSEWGSDPSTPKATGA